MALFSNHFTSQLSLCFLGLWLFFQSASNCSAQESGPPNGKVMHKSTIEMTEAPDGSFSEYYFYDDNGKMVKQLRHDQFESKHPVFKLNLPKPPSDNPDARFFEDFGPISTSSENPKPKINLGEKLSALRSLQKDGLIVKTPEKATSIIGHPILDQRPIISKPANKFLIKIETARIVDAFADETEGTSNSLLDCSYITIYDYNGNVFKEILIPDKIVTFASISDDGHYLIGICEYSLVWDEGLSSKPEGVLLVDLQTKEMNYVVTAETHNPFDANSVLFADQYFQMTFDSPWSGGKCHRLFLDPIKRAYYTKTYAADPSNKRKAIMAKSFSQFDGIRENLKDFEGFSY